MDSPKYLMFEPNFYQTAPYFNNLQKQVIQFVDEKFKPIEGHEDFLISNYGRVYSCKVDCILNEFDDQQGYLQCNIDRRPMKIHRLVAKAFVPNPDPEHKICVNHKSGQKANNYAPNLEWCTHSENTKHAYEHNLEKSKIGENNGRVVHTEAEVRQVCTLLEQGLTFRQIADKMGYDYHKAKHFISNISSRVAWSHVTKDYNF